MQSSKSTVGVRVDDKIGFVYVEMGKLRCSTCTYNVNKCCHVDYIREITGPSAENFLSEVPDVVFELLAKEKEWKPASSYVLKPVSYLPIPFEIPANLAKKIAAGYNQFLPKVDDVIHLLPDGMFCEQCEATLLDDILIGQLMLYTRMDIIPCQGKASSVKRINSSQNLNMTGIRYRHLH